MDIKKDQLEKLLNSQQYFGGEVPTIADAKTFEGLKLPNLSPHAHPNLYAWYTLVARFTEQVRK